MDTDVEEEFVSKVCTIFLKKNIIERNFGHTTKEQFLLKGLVELLEIFLRNLFLQMVTNWIDIVQTSTRKNNIT